MPEVLSDGETVGIKVPGCSGPGLGEVPRTLAFRALRWIGCRRGGTGARGRTTGARGARGTADSEGSRRALRARNTAAGAPLSGAANVG